jgi:uncharacterized protein with ParB-like and HNH nuclease domain
MIKKVDQTSVADIFSINSDRIYRIPKYQREYTWGKRDWDALFKDVTENDNGYFLGSYICVNSGSINGTSLEVIDGQQRFTTLTLLLTALYEKLSALESQMEAEDKTDLANLRGELANKKQQVTVSGRKYNYTQRLILQKQNMNDEDYSYLLSSKHVITENKNKPINFGNRRIAKAYTHFLRLINERVEEIKADNPDTDDISALFFIKSQFEQAIMVGIEVDTNKDAYMLFESLNKRGVPLSAIDLIKNTLIATADSESDADDAYELWKQILNNIAPNDYSVQERFFRQYYNAFREELNKPYNDPDKKYHFGYLATRTTLLDIYEQMIKHNYRALLDDLYDKSQKYALIVNNSDEEHSYTSALLDLDRISGAPSYLLLLYLFSMQESLKLTDDNLQQIVRLLIVFFVRRSVTDIPNTRKLTQLFIDIISDIKLLQGDAVISCVSQKLKSVAAADEEFESKLRGSLYDENPDAVRFLLCSIEAKHQTKEIYSNLWSRDSSNKYIWTIEHIFPEGQNIPDPWVNMIANGDMELAKQYLSEYAHTLGNLTITGYNQNLSNMSFEKKKDRKSKDKSKDIGYRNGLFLNQDVVTQDTWTINKIKDRTNKIVKILLEMYKW